MIAARLFLGNRYRLRPDRHRCLRLFFSGSEHRIFVRGKYIITPNEAGSKPCFRRCVDFYRCSGLFDLSLIQQADPVRHDHGLILVMGHKHRGHI